MLEKALLQFHSSPALRNFSKAYYSLSAHFLSTVSSHPARKSFFLRNSFPEGEWFSFNSDIDSLTITKDLSTAERAVFTKRFASRYALSRVLFPFLGEALVFEERDLAFESFSRMLGFKENRSFSCLDGEPALKPAVAPDDPPLPSAFESFYAKLFQRLFCSASKQFVRPEARYFEKLADIAFCYGVSRSPRATALLRKARSTNFFPKEPAEFREALCFEALLLAGKVSSFLCKRFGEGKRKGIIGEGEEPASPVLNLPSVKSIVSVPSYFDALPRFLVLVENSISQAEFSKAAEAVGRSLPRDRTLVVTSAGLNSFLRFLGTENGALLPLQHKRFSLLTCSEEVLFALPEKKWVRAKIFEEAAFTLSYVLNLSALKLALGRSSENIYRLERLSAYCDELGLPSKHAAGLKGSVELCRSILEFEEHA